MSADELDKVADEAAKVAVIQTQATYVLSTDDWEGDLGWTVSPDLLPDIERRLREKADQVRSTIAAYNRACLIDSPEDVLEGYPAMDEGEYLDRYFGPRAVGSAFKKVS